MLRALDISTSYWSLQGRLGRLIHSIKNVSGVGPLSTRSVVALLLLLYLLIGPIRGSADIVSAALTYALLLVITVTSTLVAIHGAVLKRGVAVSISAPIEPTLSGEAAQIALRIERARILPFLFLDVTLDFARPGTSSAVVRISGLRRDARTTYIETLFPHRGSWEIRGVRCSLRDVTGLARSCWKIVQPCAITVAPPTSHESNLPILSSTQRPGELVLDIFNKQGEPFEIKSYHPSDGMKKIVWKAFAKRGELLSRHPEASMNPEGFVVMFVIADQEGDSACAHALAYAHSLASLNLDIIAGCEGGAARSPARSPESLRDLLIDSVWDTSRLNSPLLSDATALIDHCRNLTPGIAVNKLLIFTDSKRISAPTRAQAIETLAQWLGDQGISPVFCLPRAQPLGPVDHPSWISRVGGLFVSREKSNIGELDVDAYNSFLTSCLTRRWEVYT